MEELMALENCNFVTIMVKIGLGKNHWGGLKVTSPEFTREITETDKGEIGTTRGDTLRGTQLPVSQYSDQDHTT